MEIFPFLIPITAILAGTTMALGLPLIRAHARRVELQGQQPALPPEVAARLERMEQAIDAVAVEVERIAEGQRFVTRLLAGRAPDAPPNGLPNGLPTALPDGLPTALPGPSRDAGSHAGATAPAPATSSPSYHR